MHVSSGEPGQGWKRSVKWLRLAVVLLIGTWLVVLTQQPTAIIVAGAAAVAVLLFRFRFTEQRFDLLIDRQPVRLHMYTDVSDRTWIRWTSGETTVRACIGEGRGSRWADYEIVLDEKSYRLRIWIRPLGDGYMISNYGREFEMAVLRNTYCC